MKRVFVFEKDRDILEIISHVLIEEGYKVEGFGNEKEFLSQIVVKIPDLILLDVVRISPEGTALCKQLKIIENIKHIPVIVLSTHDKAIEVKKICADEVVSKPFDVDMLLQVVETHLAA